MQNMALPPVLIQKIKKRPSPQYAYMMCMHISHFHLSKKEVRKLLQHYTIILLSLNPT